MSKRPSATNNDPGFLYNQKRLLKLFTLSSAALVAGIVAMILADFDRPWKHEQRAQLKWEAGKLAVEAFLLETATQGDRAELERAREAARKVIADREAELAALRKRVEGAQGSFYGADMAFKAQKQYTGEAQYELDEAKSPAEAESAAARLRRERNEEKLLGIAAREAADILDKELAALKATEKELDDLVARERANPSLKKIQLLAAAVEKKKGYSPLREIPLLDFLAPPTRVEQVVLENLVDNYEFATPRRVDRCGTCHIGINRLGFEDEKWPVEILSADAGDPDKVQRFEEAVYRFVYGLIDSVHPPVARASPFEREESLLRTVEIHHQALEMMFASYDRTDGAIAVDKKTGRKLWRRWSHDEAKGRWVSGKEGVSVAEQYLSLLQRMRKHWRTHPHFEQMVGDTSPHPYEKVGCTICHNGRGWSTDFGFAYHTPDRLRVEDWMTTARAHEEDHHLPAGAGQTLEEAMQQGSGGAAVTTGWVTDHATGERWEHTLGWTHEKTHHWIWPQLPKMLVQSSCLKCHKEGYLVAAEPEYAEVRIGKPDPAVPDAGEWGMHAKANFRDPAAEAAGEYAGRLFIPESKGAYRPESLERGLDNFVSFGCYGCHKLDETVYPFMKQMRSKVGPQLDEIARKTSREWLQKWIWNPKDFRPGTRMPRFFGLSNNSHQFTYRFAEQGDDAVDGMEWSRAEAYALVEWLLEKSGRESYPPVDLSRADPARGEKILVGDYEASGMQAKACIACHDVPIQTPELAVDREKMAEWVDGATHRTLGWKGRMARRHGPDLTGVGSKVTKEWLYHWLLDPRGYWHETGMPDLRLTPDEARDVTAYLMGSRHAAFDALDGLELNQPTLRKIAQELKVGEQQESTAQALGIVERMTPREQVLYVGEKLFKHYGCFGCHETETFKGATPIGTELTEWGSKLIDRLAFNHAPIEHTRFDFAFAKLINPRVYDHGMAMRDLPFERLKMPRFGFTPEEARDLATFLVGLVNDPIPAASAYKPDARHQDILDGRLLVRRYNCQGCHVIESEGGDIWPAIAADKWRPPSLLGQGIKTQPAWLFRFLENPAFVSVPGVADSDRVRPWHSIRMPTYHFSESETRKLVRYFAALSGTNADFDPSEADSLTGPAAQYATPQSRLVPDPKDKTKRVEIRVGNRLEEARALFKVYDCKTCHVTGGDLTKAAPNFRHAHGGRLRDSWIPTWLWGPGKLQPGTAMPGFFGEKAPAAEDKTYFGGDAAEQIRALRDYIRHHYREED